MSNTNNETPTQLYDTIRQLIAPSPHCDAFQIKMDEGFIGVRNQKEMGIEVSTQELPAGAALLILFGPLPEAGIDPGITLVA